MPTTLDDFLKRKIEIEAEISKFIAERIEEIQKEGVMVKNITVSDIDSDYSIHPDVFVELDI